MTASFPVVVTGLQDPVAIGVAKSYLHPGANFTGVMNGGPDATGKVIEIVRDIFRQ